MTRTTEATTTDHPRRYRADLSEWWCDTCQTITDWCEQNA